MTEPLQPETREAILQRQYGLYVAPYLELARDSYRLADGYTQTIVRSAFALNGGAITLLPAAFALRSDPEATAYLVYAFATFFLGLCLAVMFALMCRQNLYCVSDRYELQAAGQWLVILKRLAVDHGGSMPPAEPAWLADKEAAARSLDRSSRISYAMAVAFGILAYAAFIIGAALASRALLGRWVWV